jgi:poly(hydroxyalkanoate) depolymerase family esterase
MRLPRLPEMSTLLRRPARKVVSTTHSIAATIDAALRKAGLMRADVEPTSQRDARADSAAIDPEPVGRAEIVPDPGAASGAVDTSRAASVPLPKLAPPRTARVAKPRSDAGLQSDAGVRTAPLETGFLAAELSTPFGHRPYKLFVPPALPTGPRPLLVMLHGCTQDPDDFATGTRMNELAGQHGLLVLYPMQRSSDNPSRCWNWFRPADQTREGGEPALLAELTRHVMRQYPVDADRVYVAGLSAGAAMAGILVREFPDLYAAAGMHSGLAAGAARDVGSALAAMHGRARPTAPPRELRSPVPVIVFHGDKDRTVVPANAEHIIASHRVGAASSRRGSHGRHYTVTTYDTGPDHTRAESWLIEGAAHAWSGGDPRGSHTDADGPDASREMVRFFLENPRRAAE